MQLPSFYIVCLCPTCKGARYCRQRKSLSFVHHRRTVPLCHMDEEPESVVEGRMKIDHEIPLGTLRAHNKEFEDVSPSIRKGLENQRAKSHLIPGILEDNHVMRIARNGLGKSPRWKQILTQVQDHNVSMM